MAKRTASAKKQARASVRRTVRNRAVRSEVKTKIVKARRSLTGGPVAESDRYAIALEAIRALARQLVKLGGASAAAAATAGGRSKKGAPPAKGAAAAAAKTKAPDKKAAGKKPGSK